MWHFEFTPFPSGSISLSSVPALAEAMESLRENMIIFRHQLRYQLRYAGFGKHKLTENPNSLKPELERCTGLVQQQKSVKRREQER